MFPAKLVFLISNSPHRQTGMPLGKLCFSAYIESRNFRFKLI